MEEQDATTKIFKEFIPDFKIGSVTFTLLNVSSISTNGVMTVFYKIKEEE